LTDAGEESSGEARALRVLGILERAEKDPALQLQVREALDRASSLAHAYASLLFEAGAMDDRTAARKLGAVPANLVRSAEELETLLLEATAASSG